MKAPADKPTLRPISKAAQGLLKRIVDRLGRYERIEYLTYCQGKGLTITTVEDFELADQLHRAGWLRRGGALFDPEPLFLSKAAWEVYTLKEVHELEEKELKSIRGPDAGSW